MVAPVKPYEEAISTFQTDVCVNFDYSLSFLPLHFFLQKKIIYESFMQALEFFWTFLVPLNTYSAIMSR